MLGDGRRWRKACLQIDAWRVVAGLIWEWRHDSDIVNVGKGQKCDMFKALVISDNVSIA